MAPPSDPAVGWLNPNSVVGAVVLGVLAFALSFIVALLIRRGTRRIQQHLTDVTALGFVSAFAQLLTYLFGFVLYAHLIPELRAFGTALLAGVSVISWRNLMKPPSTSCLAISKRASSRLTSASHASK